MGFNDLVGNAIPFQFHIASCFCLNQISTFSMTFITDKLHFDSQFATYLISFSWNLQLLSFLSEIPSVHLIVVCSPKISLQYFFYKVKRMLDALQLF
jgi:hypothetical protein